MNKTTLALIAGTAMLCGALAQNVQAQPPGYPFGPYGGMPGYGYQYMPPASGYPSYFEDYTDLLEDRFDWMEERLDIRSDQKTAWNAFRDAVLKEIDAREELHKSFRRDRPDDALEMDARRITVMEQRLAGMKAIAQARRDLFAVLDNKQRDEASDLMTRHHPRGGSDGYWGY
ncbi:MAG: Spy/CpxP family protein refolding chaperone [Nitrospirae bacterium]|nr:Spy/CpxP family protein refolding chaperone [Nitrospirota bacterium]